MLYILCVYCTVLYTKFLREEAQHTLTYVYTCCDVARAMAGLSSSTPTFAYNIVSKQGRYVLNITNATKILAIRSWLKWGSLDPRRWSPGPCSLELQTLVNFFQVAMLRGQLFFIALLAQVSKRTRTHTNSQRSWASVGAELVNLLSSRCDAAHLPAGISYVRFGRTDLQTCIHSTPHRLFGFSGAGSGPEPEAAQRRLVGVAEENLDSCPSCRSRLP